ncbi:MAG: hypothetical protein U0136_04680 [Bdellovibrionota bacterium]
MRTKTSKSGRNQQALLRESYSADERAFTLVEVIVVVTLLVVMGGLALSRLGGIEVFQYRSAVRHFVNTWEFVRAQAKGRGESYRLLIDLDRQTYTVRREVPLTSNDAKTVDYLREFRTKSELERRAKEQDQKLKTLDEEYQAEDARQGDALETLFYQTIFRDSEQSYRLGVPLEFPSLKDDQRLPRGVRVRDVTIGGDEVTSGIAAIRFSANGASEFAVVHFEVGDTVQTAVANPATGKVSLDKGDLKFEWALGKK